MIREAKTGKALPGYDAPAAKRDLKMPPTKAATPKKLVGAAKAAKERALKRPAVAPKTAFKGVIMALNGEGVYKKQTEKEIEEEHTFTSAFSQWLKSGKTGEFIAIRRR